MHAASGFMVYVSSEPPSMPINVMISSMTSNSVTLTWDEPLDLGGRLDLSYELCYQVVASGEEECTTVTTTTGTITRGDSRI